MLLLHFAYIQRYNLVKIERWFAKNRRSESSSVTSANAFWPAPSISEGHRPSWSSKFVAPPWYKERPGEVVDKTRPPQYLENIFFFLHSLWCAIQDEVNIMGGAAAWGLWRHLKYRPKTTAILNFTTIKSYPKTGEIKIFSCEYDTMLLFVDIYTFFYWKRSLKTRTFIQTWLDHVLRMTSNQINRFSPNFAKLCLSDMKIAAGNDKCW